MTALDDAIAEENGAARGRGPTQADILIELAQSAELFHTPGGAGFADLDIDGHRETWPIRAKGFRRWLARRFYEETGPAPSSEALQSALNVIEPRRISMRPSVSSMSASAGWTAGSISTSAMRRGVRWKSTPLLPRLPLVNDTIAVRTTKVVLATAHLDHDPTNNRPRNLNPFASGAKAIGDLFLGLYRT